MFFIYRLKMDITVQLRLPFTIRSLIDAVDMDQVPTLSLLSCEAFLRPTPGFISYSNVLDVERPYLTFGTDHLLDNFIVVDETKRRIIKFCEIIEFMKNDLLVKLYTPKEIEVNIQQPINKISFYYKKNPKIISIQKYYRF